MNAPDLPEGAVVNCTVRVDQWLDSDGEMRTRVYYDGSVPRSQIVGLLCIAAMDVWNGLDDE